MPVGLQLFGEDGTLWADTNLMPAGLIKSGIFPGNNQYYHSITVQANAPVIFFRTVGGNYWNPGASIVSPENMVRLESTSQSGRTWTFNCEVVTDPNGYVAYYIFDTNIGSAGNYGLQVFDESGVCIFNSNNPPLRTTAWVLSDNEYGYGYRLWGTTYVSLPAVAAFSVSAYRRGFTSAETTQPYSDYYKSFCGIIQGNGAIFTYALLWDTANVSGPVAGSWTNQTTPYLTVADVSNCPLPFN